MYIVITGVSILGFLAATGHLNFVFNDFPSIVTHIQSIHVPLILVSKVGIGLGCTITLAHSFLLWVKGHNINPKPVIFKEEAEIGLFQDFDLL